MTGPTGVRVALVLDVAAHTPEGAYAVLDVAWQHLAGQQLRVEVETTPPTRGTFAGPSRTPDDAPAVAVMGPDGARQDVPLDAASHVTLWLVVPRRARP